LCRIDKDETGSRFRLDGSRGRNERRKSGMRKSGIRFFAQILL
jgi:hypothetical protein